MVHGRFCRKEMPEEERRVKLKVAEQQKRQQRRADVNLGQGIGKSREYWCKDLREIPGDKLLEG